MSASAGIRLADGSVGFLRGPHVQACHHCGMIAEYLCDYPVGSRLCSIPICSECAVPVGAEHHEWTQTHYCSAHGRHVRFQVDQEWEEELLP